MAYGTTYNHDISINYPSTDHDYHAYNGTTIPITWQTEAGTVYGGTLDVTSGVLTVDKQIADLGDVIWSPDPNRPGVFYGGISGREPSSPIYACSEYLVRTESVTTDVDFYISGKESYGGGVIFVRDTRYATSTGVEYKTAATGIKCVFKLATPVTYQLTEQELKTLLGQNNIWATANGDTTVEYRADTKLYIQKVLS